MPVRLATAAVSALVLCSLLAPAASAQVHVDPGGPAGKQYSDSLDEARAHNSDADPATALPGAGTGDPPLFGEGVSPPSEQKDGTESQSGSASGGEPAAGGSSPDRSGSTGTLLALIAGVVALGGLAGMGIARLSRRQPA